MAMGRVEVRRTKNNHVCRPLVYIGIVLDQQTNGGDRKGASLFYRVVTRAILLANGRGLAF